MTDELPLCDGSVSSSLSVMRNSSSLSSSSLYDFLTVILPDRPTRSSARGTGAGLGLLGPRPRRLGGAGGGGGGGGGLGGDGMPDSAASKAENGSRPSPSSLPGDRGWPSAGSRGALSVLARSAAMASSVTAATRAGSKSRGSERAGSLRSGRLLTSNSLSGRGGRRRGVVSSTFGSPSPSPPSRARASNCVVFVPKVDSQRYLIALVVSVVGVVDRGRLTSVRRGWSCVGR